MKVLVTGFDPFGGEKINPALEVIKQLRNNIGGAEIVKMEIPTVFGKSIDAVAKAIDEIKPDFILSIGQAGGAFAITVERVAINENDARIPDNEGNQPIDTPIDPEGENAYFATIPIKAIVQSIKEKQIPAQVSNSAGTFVCNHLMYGVLNYIARNKLNIKAGFMHIPFLTEQAVSRTNVPCMSLNTMVEAIETAIEVIVSRKEDIKAAGGQIY